MKIEVNLTGVFDEETGEVSEAVKGAIIQEATDRIYEKIDRCTDRKLDELISKGIVGRVNAHLDALIPSLMDYEFQETARYGATEGEQTTVKNRILKYLGDVCVFKERNYSSDRNAFTEAMKSIIESQMKLYKPEFDKQVNAMFVKEAMDYAVQAIRKKLGV